jgi:Mg2+-importing ATPase
VGKRAKPLDDFWNLSLQKLFQQLQATPAGLSADEASRRLRLYGPNSVAPESRFVLLVSFFRFFANPLVIILVAAAGVSFALGEHIGAAIIIAIVVFSVLLNFLMEFQAHHAVDEIRKQIAITAIVIRDGREQELPVADLMPGDVIRLKAGDLVPADARLLTVKDLQVRESALTGKSLPVEKTVIELSDHKHGIADASNSVFLGTSVQTGIGTAVIVRTGKDTACGEIAWRLAKRPPETEFARGTRHFGMMLTRVTLMLVLFVLLVNIVFHRPVLESFLCDRACRRHDA